MRWVVGFLLVASFAAATAVAQDPAVVVAAGQTLVVSGPCDGDAVLESLTTITVLGTIRADSTDCEANPAREKAPSGTRLVLKAPSIFIGRTGTLEAAPGYDGVEVPLTQVGGEHTAQHGGDSGGVLLLGNVVMESATFVEAPAGRGADITCDGVSCVPVNGTFRVTLVAGNGGNVGDLTVDGEALGTSTTIVAADGAGGDATALLSAFVGRQEGDDGMDVVAIGGAGGESGFSNGRGGDATAHAPNGRSGQDNYGTLGRDGGRGGEATAKPGVGGNGTAIAGNGGHGGHAIIDPCERTTWSGGRGGDGGMAVVHNGGVAQAGHGGNGGDSRAIGGTGGDGGKGGWARAIQAPDGGARGGDGGTGGAGQKEGGAFGAAGIADFIGDVDWTEPGMAGQSGRTFEGVSCKDIAAPTTQGEPNPPSYQKHEEPAPAQVIWMIIGVLATTLFARRRL